MANVFNRKTKQYLTSVHTPDYSESQWIINPDFIPDCKTKYMVVKDDIIREMTIEEKVIVDYTESIPELTVEELAIKAVEEQKQNIQREIELTYSLTDKMGIIRKALTELLPKNIDVQMWNDAVKAIEAKYLK